MTKPVLILASASPRRADLLRWAGVPFEIDPAAIDETKHTTEEPVEYALRLAREKALAKARPGRLSLGADTTVYIGGDIFDKPVDSHQATEHLKLLSGRTHQVVTAIALATGEVILESTPIISRVTFRTLSPLMIKNYVATGEGLDKAGAYGLQGLGGFLVECIEGSYSAVIGLPLEETLKAVKRYPDLATVEV